MKRILGVSYLTFFATICWLFLMPGMRTSNVYAMIDGLEAVMCMLGPMAAVTVVLMLGRRS